MSSPNGTPDDASSDVQSNTSTDDASTDIQSNGTPDDTSSDVQSSSSSDNLICLNENTANFVIVSLENISGTLEFIRNM